MSAPTRTELALLTLLAFAAAPVLEVWAANPEQGLTLAAVLAPLLGAPTVALVLLAVLQLCWPRASLARLALALGPTLLLLFAYGAPRAALGRAIAEPTVWQCALLALGWSAVCIAIGVGLHRRSASRVWSDGLLLLSVVVLAMPVVTLALAAPRDEMPAGTAVSATTAPSGPRPNIYWLIADSYPRVDALRDELGLDGEPLLAGLAELGFTVNRGVYANYPFTRQSLASTLDAALPITEATPLAEYLAETYTLEAVRGEGRVLRALTAAGYAFVRVDSGYDTMTGCSGREDLCLRSSTALSEFELALIGRSPAGDLGLWRATQLLFGTAPSFEWRGFDAVGESLPRLSRSRAPRIALIHVMAPHPPLRYDAECRFQPYTQYLVNWNERSRAAFGPQLRCVDRQLLELLPDLVAADPEAIVILTSDHGSAFRGQFQRDHGEMTRADLVERFGVLAAARLPERCRAGFGTLRTLANLYPEVLGCALGLELPRAPDALFVLPIDHEQGRILRHEPPTPDGGPAVATPPAAR